MITANEIDKWNSASMVHARVLFYGHHYDEDRYVTDLIGTITESEICQGGLTIDRYCASGESMPIGEAISAELELSVFDTENASGLVFASNVDFIRVHVFVEGSLTTMGVFYPKTVSQKGNVITLRALDGMSRFDHTIDTSAWIGGLTYPISLKEFLSGIIVDATYDENLPQIEWDGIKTRLNETYSISERPVYDNGTTYRKILKDICFIMGVNAFFDGDGFLVLSGYKTGTKYTEFFSTDTLDIPKNTIFDMTMIRKNLTTSGLVYTNKKGRVRYSGTLANPYEYSDNRLLQQNVYPCIRTIQSGNNVTYRYFSASILSAGYIYPMQRVRVYYGNTGGYYYSFVTHMTFRLNALTEIGCLLPMEETPYYPGTDSLVDPSHDEDDRPSVIDAT